MAIYYAWAHDVSLCGLGGGGGGGVGSYDLTSGRGSPLPQGGRGYYNHGVPSPAITQGLNWLQAEQLKKGIDQC
jgi:hypothetical protein